MTASAIIERTDALFPNVYHFPHKAQWLFELDKKISEDILSRYEDFSAIKGSSRDADRELLLPEEYSGLYISYLSMLMELYSGNITGYQNRAALFNSQYLSFINAFNRTHLMKSVSIKIE